MPPPARQAEPAPAVTQPNPYCNISAVTDVLQVVWMDWPGMVYYERKAVALATELALRQTREEWLPLLEAWRAKSTNILEQVLVDAEIRRLRRLLGIIPSAAARRIATRERVRQHRVRKRQGIVLRPRKDPAPAVTVESIAADVKRQAEVWRQIEVVKRQAKG
jgi:hypothetical protein